MKDIVIALDQGTTSSRAIAFRADGSIAASAQHQLTQHYPKPGWVEHDPMEILFTQLMSLRDVIESGISPKDIAAIGVTNQRETVVVWEKATGRPIMNAIVWQCRRTADICEKLIADGMTEHIRSVTGLLPDAYFSGTKLKWILDNVPGASEQARAGKLLCGTIDSWLIWNLTKGVHVTDYSNASRTMLFDIDKLCWDETMLKALDIPACMLPTPVPSSMEYGKLSALSGIEMLEGIPICGCAGDQPSALFGQACFEAGQAKNTYGTGCFMLLNTGERSLRSNDGLLTSVGWSINGKTSYALEGSVFNAGSGIQWLRDELGIINTARECDILAESVPDSAGMYFVSAFTGLGAPHWDMYARGAAIGITRGTTKAHLCRAVLEGIAYQTSDLMSAMERTAGPMRELRVDGGACVSDLMMQFQADLIRINVDRPRMVETTAAGAAYLAGLAAGVWSSTDEILKNRVTERVFIPSGDEAEIKEKLKKWHDAVERSKAWADK